MKNAAKTGLRMHKAGFRGGTKTGWARARQLAQCTHVDEKTAKTMRAWYARHRKTSYPGYRRWVRDGKPTTLEPGTKNKYRGAVAWLLWGGDAGWRFVQQKRVRAIS